ncbi:MAG: exo-alpha-sialidase, partial [Candidatus Methylomirabilis sp.]|nr:exo-alpha-sialidase [Deltaproteobacteria bacterium]
SGSVVRAETGGVPAGLFHSADGGDSWTLCESLWSVPERKEWGGAGNMTPALHTILVEKGDPRRIVVAISTGGVYRTEDGGRTWDGRATGWRAEYYPPELASVHYHQDVHRVGRCAAAPQALWAQHHNGVFRSTDGGKAWTEIKGVKPSVFGFAVAAHPKDPETAWFVPAQKDEVRAPVGGRFVVNRTRDGGRTFETLTAGLPNTAAYDLVYRHGLDVDGSGERLAMGSTTGGLWVSESGGERWTLLSVHLPPIYGVRFAPS